MSIAKSAVAQEDLVPAVQPWNPLWVLTDAWTVTKRNLIAYTRIPGAIVFSSVQPIMFVLLFRYVFAGAIHTPGFDYVDYLMPGIFVQSVAFGAVSTSIGLAEDLQKGIVERFRALPMARSAVLAGRTTADLVRNVFVMILMIGVGFGVGYRVHTGVRDFLGGALLVLAFSYTLSWGFAVIGMSAPNSETAQVMSFPVLFPFTFASSAFVPLQTMPGWLQGFAANQPVTKVVNAARGLMSGHIPGTTTATATIEALAWIAGMAVVFAPLAVAKYRNRI